MIGFVGGGGCGDTKCVLCGMGKGSGFVYVGMVGRTDGMKHGVAATGAVGRTRRGRSVGRARWDGMGRDAMMEGFDVAREGAGRGWRR